MSKKELDDTIKSLKDAASQLEKVQGASDGDVDTALTDVQSCCGTCTGISPLPPCENTCIKVSPLF
jgi:hypothetical protein